MFYLQLGVTFEIQGDSFVIGKPEVNPDFSAILRMEHVGHSGTLAVRLRQEHVDTVLGFRHQHDGVQAAELVPGPSITLRAKLKVAAKATTAAALFLTSINMKGGRASEVHAVKKSGFHCLLLLLVYVLIITHKVLKVNSILKNIRRLKKEAQASASSALLGPGNFTPMGFLLPVI